MLRGWQFLQPGGAEPAGSHRWLDTLLHLTRVLVPLGALLVGGWQTLLGAVAVQEAALWLVRRLAPADAQLTRLFLAAFAGRAALAVPLHAWRVQTLASGGLFQDDDTYDRVADALSRVWRGEGTAVFTGYQHLLDSSYAFLLGSLYFVLGHVPLVGKLLSAAVAAVCVVLLYQLAHDAFDASAARLAGVLAVVLPTLVIWSLVELKEMPTLGALLVALRAMQLLDASSLRSPAGQRRLLALAASLAVVADLRPPLVAILAVLPGVLVGLRAASGVRPRSAALATVAVGVVLVAALAALQASAPASALARATRLDEVARQLAERRGWEATAARSQFGQTAGDPVVEFEDIASAFGFALLAPAPWQAQGTRELAASAEMLAWYALIGLGVLSWRVPGTPAQRRFRVLLAVYGLAMWGSLALAEGNLGNLLRHRVMLTPTVLVLGAGGGAYAWQRWGRHRVGRAFPAPSRVAAVPLRSEPVAGRVPRGG